MKQLGLFGEAAALPPAPAIEIETTEADEALGRSLPPNLRFGTSSWSFPGWAGIVWRGAPTEADLARSGLEAYARHPLLRAVGLDRSHYAPLRREDLAAYALQLDAARAAVPALPPFRVVSKVWDELTTAVFPRHPRYGARAGSVNPAFLDAERFATEVLAPYADTFRAHAGPFVFELTPMPRGALDERTLVSRVDDFLSRLPSGPAGPRWAFELRNAELFGPRWLDMLRAHRAQHVFTYWTAMPSLREQLMAATRARLLPAARGVLVRLMLPPFTRYAARKADFAPFAKIVEPQPAMREDVIAILRAAFAAGASDGVVLVNNKAEGSAPLTIRALAKQAALALA